VTPVVPRALIEQTGDPAFWEEYFIWDARDEYPREVRATCRFPAGRDYALILDARVDLPLYDLSLEHPGSERTHIAEDNDAHPIPDVLRWEELELVSRCAALVDPSLPHPGIPLLLLCRFAPICVGDDVDMIVSLLDAAWQAVPAVDPKDVTRYIERLDERGSGLEWRETDRGWALQMSDDQPYSFRVEGNRVFPFEEMEALRRAAEAEVLASPNAPKEPPRSRRKLRPRFILRVTIPDNHATAGWERLDAALRETGIGIAEAAGGSFDPALEAREDWWRIELRGDFDAALEVVRSAMSELDLPPGSKLELEQPGPRRNIEL
jgi:hypothetical protein